MNLDAADLVAPVRRCLGSSTAIPTSWTVEKLGGGFGNPATAGVFRVLGAADDGNDRATWRMVMKALRDPRTVGKPFLGSAADHWNYWRRELDLATSSFFADLPPAISAPTVYGTDDRADGQVWIWSEDVQDAGTIWDEQRFCEVAHRVGRFSGAYLAGTPLPTNRSLCGGFARSWARTLLGVYSYLDDPSDRRHFWAHPVVVRLLGAPADNPLLAFVDDLDRHLAVLDLLPRTLCHRDLWTTNVLWPTADRCALIDWGMVGPGPVGEDLAQLSYSAYDLDITDRLVDAYISGLRDAGWTGPEALVRYAHEASLVVRNGFLLIAMLHGSPTDLQPIRTGRAAAAVLSDAAVDKYTGILPVVTAAATAAIAMVDDVAHILPPSR